MIRIKVVRRVRAGNSSAMCSRKWLVVLAAAALAGACAARPGSGNDIEDAAKPSKETVHVLVDAQATPTAPRVDSAKPVEEAKVEDVAAGEAKSVVVKSKDVKDEVVKSEDVQSEDIQSAKIQEEPLAKAVHEQFPHAVLFGGTCGGSIISPNWVLTAGHCTLFTGGRYVLAGTNNSDDGSGVERTVKRLVIHPLFSVGPYWLDAKRFNIKQVAANWDFLLAELEEPLPLDGKTMAAVELNEEPVVPEGLHVGYGGYGAEHHGDTMRHEMHGMELEVKADSFCQEALPQYRAQDMLCTQGRAPDYDSACNGDSGSGLVAGGKLYGVASWVEEDAFRCFNGARVVFSRVSSVRDWIRQVTRI